MKPPRQPTLRLRLAPLSANGRGTPGPDFPLAVSGSVPAETPLRNENMTFRPSVEVLARTSRRFRTAVDASLMNVSLGDTRPGRSALDELRCRPTTEAAPKFTISAKKADTGDRANLERAARLREVASRLRRMPGPHPCRGGGQPKPAPGEPRMMATRRPQSKDLNDPQAHVANRPFGVPPSRALHPARRHPRRGDFER
jgi:hypothetical protein